MDRTQEDKQGLHIPCLVAAGPADSVCADHSLVGSVLTPPGSHAGCHKFQGLWKKFTVWGWKSPTTSWTSLLWPEMTVTVQWPWALVISTFRDSGYCHDLSLSIPEGTEERALLNSRYFLSQVLSETPEMQKK